MQLAVCGIQSGSYRKSMALTDMLMLNFYKKHFHFVTPDFTISTALSEMRKKNLFSK